LLLEPMTVADKAAVLSQNDINRWPFRLPANVEGGQHDPVFLCRKIMDTHVKPIAVLASLYFKAGPLATSAIFVRDMTHSCQHFGKRSEAFNELFAIQTGNKEFCYARPLAGG
jgi:hypothetical protein